MLFVLLLFSRCGRAARAGRSGAALSLLTRDELPFLLDLHLYLGREVLPAPFTPDQQQLDHAAAAAGGLTAAATAAGEGLLPLLTWRVVNSCNSCNIGLLFVVRWYALLCFAVLAS